MESNFTQKWKTYAEWNDDHIKGFFGRDEYMFLSNFYPSEVFFDGDLYPTSENAYQAAKFPRELRKPFFKFTPREAKTLGNNKSYYAVNMEWWDDVKYLVMNTVVFDKFYRNIELRQRLLCTDNKHLEETNHWNDVFWGVDYKSGKGRNTLGYILMQTRTFMRYNFTCGNMEKAPFSEKITCRGSYLLGSACGHCERCDKESEMIKMQGIKL